MDNPYLDPDKADQARVDNFDGAKKKAYEANQKAVVLVKNHEKLLPLAKSQKVCIVTFKGVDSGFAQMAQAMGAGLGNTDEDAALRKTLTEAFEKKGYTVVATPEEAMCSTCTSGPSATVWCSTSTQCPSSRWARSSLTSASATRARKRPVTRSPLSP